MDRRGQHRGVADHDHVDVGQSLIAPHEVALRVAADVGVKVAHVAAVRRPPQVSVMEFAQRLGIALDERPRAPLRREQNLVARAHAVSCARRDSPRISARMRSRRGSVVWSTCFIAAATVG